MHSAHITYRKHISCLFLSSSLALFQCQCKHFLWLVMRCCRNFSCIEWLCVCKSFLCYGNKSSCYASSPPTFHIILLQLFGIRFLTINFFPPYSILVQPRFWIATQRIECGAFITFKCALRFGYVRSNDLATESSRSIILNSLRCKKFQHSFGQFYCRILLPHAHILMLQLICTWVYAVQSHFVASSEISVWLTFVYISEFHCNPIIILSSQNHSLEFLTYFMICERKENSINHQKLGIFPLQTKPHSAVCIHAMNHVRTMEWMCILK